VRAQQAIFGVLLVAVESTVFFWASVRVSWKALTAVSAAFLTLGAAAAAIDSFAGRSLAIGIGRLRDWLDDLPLEIGVVLERPEFGRRLVHEANAGHKED
jgi:hypothetical protein